MNGNDCEKQFLQNVCNSKSNTVSEWWTLGNILNFRTPYSYFKILRICW